MRPFPLIKQLCLATAAVLLFSTGACSNRQQPDTTGKSWNTPGKPALPLQYNTDWDGQDLKLELRFSAPGTGVTVNLKRVEPRPVAVLHTETVGSVGPGDVVEIRKLVEMADRLAVEVSGYINGQMTGSVFTITPPVAARSGQEPASSGPGIVETDETGRNIRVMPAK